MSTARGFSTVITGIAAGALVVAGVSGCGDEEPTDTPTTTSAASSDDGGATTPADNAASTRPDVAPPDPRNYPGKDEQTEEGAQQAVRFFWAVAMSAYATGNTGDLETLKSDNCSYCDELIKEIDNIHSDGGYWSAVTIEDRLLESRQSSPNVVQVSYGFLLGPHSEKDDSSAKSREEPEQLYATGVQLVWQDDSWKVDGVDIETE